MEVQQEKQDGAVVSKHCLQSRSGQTALSMSDIEARPIADRAGSRARASVSAGIPASAGQPKAIASQRPGIRQIDADWVPPLEAQADLTDSPEYVPRSLEGPPPGLSDKLMASFRQLSLRNSLPPGTHTRSHAYRALALTLSACSCACKPF